jgi:hypothetical protein
MMFSSLLGFVLGYLLMWYLYNPVEYHGPDSKDIVGKVFEGADGKSWTYEPVITVCPIAF